MAPPARRRTASLVLGLALAAALSFGIYQSLVSYSRHHRVHYELGLAGLARQQVGATRAVLRCRGTGPRSVEMSDAGSTSGPEAATVGGPWNA